jgi:hypothetical protein
MRAAANHFAADISEHNAAVAGKKSPSRKQGLFVAASYFPKHPSPVPSLS